MNDTPAVLVTDAGRGSAVSIIRSLGRRGYRVIAADSQRGSLGFCSKYVRETVVYPSPEKHPKQFTAAILQAALRRGVNLIIPVTDPAILPLSEARDRFHGICQLALPEATALSTACDKLATLDVAQRLEIPVPQTRMVESVEQAVAVGGTLGWPVVLKPRFSRCYQNGLVEHFAVSYADNEEELVLRMQTFEGRCPVLLQEYHAGHGVGVELLTYDGHPLAAFQHRRIREMPIHGGPSALRESTALDGQLYMHSARLLRAIRWTGLAMIEFKVGDRGARLMEINGRIWGSLPLALYSGMDFPARLVELWLQGPPEIPPTPDCSYKLGVRVRNLELDLAWILTVLINRRSNSLLELPARREALAAMLQLANPGYRCDVLSLADPRPGMAELRHIARKFIQKFRQPS